eukprot:4390652-Prymnesium_polylepis.1
MHTCTHPAARGHVPACPDGATCLPACLLGCQSSIREVRHSLHGFVPFDAVKHGHGSVQAACWRPTSTPRPSHTHARALE